MKHFRMTSYFVHLQMIIHPAFHPKYSHKPASPPPISFSPAPAGLCFLSPERAAYTFVLFSALLRRHLLVHSHVVLSEYKTGLYC